MNTFASGELLEKVAAECHELAIDCWPFEQEACDCCGREHRWELLFGDYEDARMFMATVGDDADDPGEAFAQCLWNATPLTQPFELQISVQIPLSVASDVIARIQGVRAS